MARWYHPLERELRAAGSLIAGVDEVGRGPLAGPVVACAVIMPPDARAIRGVDDSKALSAADRERLATRIREQALGWGLGAASVREVEERNILQATVMAIRRALAHLPVRPSAVLLDGRPMASLPVPHHAIVGGDRRCYCIAAASIVAKVARDKLMRALAARHPGYGWDHNCGYGTVEHKAAIGALGVTPHHRPSFLTTMMGDPQYSMLES